MCRKRLAIQSLGTAIHYRTTPSQTLGHVLYTGITEYPSEGALCEPTFLPCPENEDSAMAVLYLIGAGVADAFAVVVLLTSAIEVT